jgi:transposase InsO family protein
VPMHAVSTDLFECAGKNYLVMVDRFSGMPFVARMTSTTTEAVWRPLMAWFLDHGLPGTIRSDNGPQFRQSFTALCTSMGILHETSSPYHPASNGLEEAAVKSMKRLLSKLGGVNNVVFQSALLKWRNTPRAEGFSPPIGFFGRRLRTLLLSALPLQFNPATQAACLQARLAADAARVEQKGGVTLAPLLVRDQVHVQDPIEKLWSF